MNKSRVWCFEASRLEEALAAWCAMGEGEASEKAAAMIRAFLYCELVQRYKMTEIWCFEASRLEEALAAWCGTGKGEAGEKAATMIEEALAAWCGMGKGGAGEKAAAMIRNFLYCELVERHKMTVEGLKSTS